MTDLADRFEKLSPAALTQLSSSVDSIRETRLAAEMSTIADEFIALEDLMRTAHGSFTDAGEPFVELGDEAIASMTVFGQMQDAMAKLNEEIEPDTIAAKASQINDAIAGIEAEPTVPEGEEEEAEEEKDGKPGKLQKALGGMEKLTNGFFSLVEASAGLDPIAKTKKAGWKAMGSAFNLVKGLAAKGPAGLLEGLVSMIGELIVAFLQVTGVLEPFNVLFDILAATLQGALAPAVQQLWEVFLSPEIIGAFTAIGAALGEALIPGVMLFTMALQMLVDSGVFDIITQFWQTMGVIFAQLGQVVLAIAEPIMGFIGGFIGVIVQVLDAVDWTTLISSIASFITIIVQVIEAIPWESFLTLFDVLLSGFMVFVDIFNSAIAGFASVLQLLAEGILYLWQFLEPIVDGIVGLFQDIITWFDNLFGSIGDFLGGLVGGGDGGGTTATGGLFDAFADLFGLAEGGVAMRPTIRPIAEEEPEAVIPLSELGEVLGGVRGEAGRAITLNMTGVFGKDAALQVRDIIWEYEKTQVS
jgi:hypothetical protein